MSTPFVGEVRLVGFTFNPYGWRICDGSLLPISEFETLFTLIGTTYGGDGQSTFAIPDLRGRAPIHQGTGTGLSTYVIGQQGGVTGVTLTSGQLPSHTHGVSANAAAGTANAPTNNFFATTANSVYTSAGSPVAMGSIVGAAGGNLSHENRQPFLTMNYVIALFGIFPSQG